MLSQTRSFKCVAALPRRNFTLRLLCLMTVWVFAMWLFFSPASMTSESVGDFLINEKWVGLKSHAKSYDSHASSHQSMGFTNVTFLGVGRNLGPSLHLVLNQIAFLSHEFGSSRAIFVEGGSKDNTSQILQSWVDSSPTNRTLIIMGADDAFESSGHFTGMKLPREGRISNARNMGLSELYRVAEQGIKTEYVIVVDLDILGWDPSGVKDSFQRSSLWDVVCANGILLHGVYRDTYAFRTEKLNTNHHWAGNDELMYNITVEEKKHYRHNLKLSQGGARAITDFSTAGKLLRVQSCFGGLAIYRYSSLEGCNYGYRHAVPPFMLDCEHVILHKCMTEKNHARIFSNSKMKLWYGHSPMATLTMSKIYNYFFG